MYLCDEDAIGDVCLGGVVPEVFGGKLEGWFEEALVEEDVGSEKVALLLVVVEIFLGEIEHLLRKGEVLLSKVLLWLFYAFAEAEGGGYYADLSHCDIFLPLE